MFIYKLPSHDDKYSIIKASKENNLLTLRYVLKTNKNLIDIKDCKGNTALHYAAENGNIEIVNLFSNKIILIRKNSNLEYYY